MKAVNEIRMGGVDVLPLIEGGKGIGVSNGISSGHWAEAGGAGTFSAVNADYYDEIGNPIEQIYKGRTRRERHDELIEFGIQGGIAQARRAYEISGGKGRIHANILWEMGGAERVISGVLEGAKGLINGLTCGAGMPYRLSDIAAKFGVHYYPIVSSSRAFNALWKRAYSKAASLLGGVVYEDPWLAGGHNGLSNGEDPERPEDPFPRVLALRKLMRTFGLDQVPIIMAGGVWWLEEWQDWIDNPELGPIAFQFGTRPLLTQESPISDAWKRRLLTLKEGDVFLNRFSPTGFYSSAVNNGFISELKERSEHQVAYTTEPVGEHTAVLGIGPRKRPVYLTPQDLFHAEGWMVAGFTEAMRTPDGTLIFVTPERASKIVDDQVSCMGCLSVCRFSNWSQHEPSFDNGKKADPRSFCIQKTLQEVRREDQTPEEIEHQLMFSGHNAYRFASDPFYSNGFIPTVKQLVERMLTGRWFGELSRVHERGAEMTTVLGIDFGTTNSVIAAIDTVTGESRTVRFSVGDTVADVFRSVLCFWLDVKRGRSTLRHAAGPLAIGAYLDDPLESRLIMSMKTYLASRSFTGTNLLGRFWSLEQLVGTFLQRLMEAAELEGTGLHVVAGRPVRFAGESADDAFGETRLRAAFAEAGLGAIDVALEPEAAGYRFTRTLDRAATVLIGDFGGGTSDFSVLRVTPGAVQRLQTLGRAGVGIAGDALDARIIDHVVAPLLGKGTSYKPWHNALPVPAEWYAALQRWHRLSLMRSPKTLRDIAEVRRTAEHPERLDRLLSLIEDEQGYALYASVSSAKAALSTAETTLLRFRHGDLTVEQTLHRRAFEQWIAPDLARMEEAIGAALAESGLADAAVDRVFLTGGTAFVPAVRALFARRFGPERIAGGGEFVSVAEGLALIGAERLGQA